MYDCLFEHRDWLQVLKHKNRFKLRRHWIKPFNGKHGSSWNGLTTITLAIAPNCVYIYYIYIYIYICILYLWIQAENPLSITQPKVNQICNKKPWETHPQRPGLMPPLATVPPPPDMVPLVSMRPPANLGSRLRRGSTAKHRYRKNTMTKRLCTYVQRSLFLFNGTYIYIYTYLILNVYIYRYIQIWLSRS